MYYFSDINKKPMHVKDNNNNFNESLCGYTHPDIKIQGERINSVWVNQHFPMAVEKGTICKECAKITIELLKN